MSKRAILVGCNYEGTDAALRGCVNDVFRMKALLGEFFGFEDFHILIDNNESYVQPTGHNIKTTLRDLVSQSQPGDILVFHFSGHGTQVPSDDPDEADMKDEAIVPTDMNLILDDDLRDIVKELPEGVNFTFVSDCCHSGGMLDHHEVQIEGPKDPEEVPKFETGNIFSMFGLREANVPVEGVKNRSLPTDQLLQMLGNQSGGGVDIGNIRNTLGNLFGDDASSRVSQYLSMAQGMMGGGGGETASGGCLMALFATLKSILGGGGGEPTFPDAQYEAVRPGNKPPSEGQLGDDVGVLITGCQSHETSADACPGGDPSKAYGALSHSIETVVRTHQEQNPGVPLTNQHLVYSVRELLSKGYYEQNPCLECSQKNARKPFITG